MTRQRFSVDTNILIYSIDKDAGPRHEQARALMDALADTDCVLSLQALGEFFHAVTRKAKMPAEEAAALLDDWMELFPVAAADRRTLRDAIGLKSTHAFGFWDAMLVETARVAWRNAAPHRRHARRSQGWGHAAGEPVQGGLRARPD